MPREVILVVGAFPSLRASAAQALAAARRAVSHSKRGRIGPYAKVVAKYAGWGRERAADRRNHEPDVKAGTSVEIPLQTLHDDTRGNGLTPRDAGHMVGGPSVASASEVLAERHDVKEPVSRHPVSIEPHSRAHGDLGAWSGSGPTRGGAPPLPGPCLAAKSAHAEPTT